MIYLDGDFRSWSRLSLRSIKGVDLKISEKVERHKNLETSAVRDTRYGTFFQHLLLDQNPDTYSTGQWPNLHLSVSCRVWV